MVEEKTITEYSFNSKLSQFVVRFLSGTLVLVKVADLPKRFQAKKTIWEETRIGDERQSLILKTDKISKVLTSTIIHRHGRVL